MSISSPASSRALACLVAISGLASALAAITLPTTAQAAEIASILAIGALALLAGHGWGLPVVTLVEVVLLGRLWPLIVYDGPPAPAVQIAMYTALLGALPGLVFLRHGLARAVELILGPQCAPRVRAAGVALGAGLSGLGLLLPLWQLAR
ncbi:MAG TPA: hypothetical protein VNM90_13240 [Haliangium sp.]|nr:hypothetical protein [Haliangium sp.]